MTSNDSGKREREKERSKTTGFRIESFSSADKKEGENS